ncbi:MAG: DnaJ domain-containing protein [Polyangiaceae bacterium]
MAPKGDGVAAETRDDGLGALIPKRLFGDPSGISPDASMLLGLIDDRTSVVDLAALLGTGVQQIAPLVSELEVRGLVDMGRPRPGGLERATEAELLEHGTARRPLERASGIAAAPAAEVEGEPLEEIVELPPELQQEISEVAERIQSSDPYVVLGCDVASSREEIRASYHAGIRRYHPDRYFGKQLGPYKAQLERIFKRLTAAYEALENALGASERASRATASSSAPPVDIPKAPRAPQVQQPSVSSRPPAAGSSRPPDAASRDSEARRRALARKFSNAGMRRVSVPPAKNSEEAKAAARESMRRLQAERSSDPRVRIQRYLQTAKEAEREHDLISARNAVKIAVGLDPEDTELAERLEKLEQAVAVKHADEYIQRGQVAERQGQWREAAQFYEKAHLGRPHNGQLLERAALCLLQTDVNQAIRLAKSAVLVAPQRPSLRVVLAKAYLAADMKKSALGEYERAKELDPTDRGVKELGKALGKR